MAKAKVDRNTDYLLRMRIRGEMAAQHVSIDKACTYAAVSQATLYRLMDSPTRYMDKTLRLLRCLTVPIEDVREAITYPW